MGFQCQFDELWMFFMKELEKFWILWIFKILLSVVLWTKKRKQERYLCGLFRMINKTSARFTVEPLPKWLMNSSTSSVRNKSLLFFFLFLFFGGRGSHWKETNTKGASETSHSQNSWKVLASKPANICLDEHVLKMPWSCLFSLSSEDVVMTNIFSQVIRLQKMSSRRHDQDECICLGHMSSRRLPKSSRLLQSMFKTFWGCLQNVLTMSCRDVFKTSSRRFQDVSSS